MSIQRVQLSPSLTVSRVITGLWQIADMEKEGQRLELSKLANAMLPYAKAGLTTFDMADHYGSAEDIAGLFSKQHPEVTVQRMTKWVPTPGPISKAEVRHAVERSLKRLKTEQLDLLQFHTWSYTDPSWLDCLFYLQELKEEGLIANLGLTNFDTAHLNMVLQSGIDIVSNQLSFSLIDQRAAGAMSELCLKHGVKLLAYGTLAGGLLSERWLGKAEPDSTANWSQSKYKRFIEVAGGWQGFQELLKVLADVSKDQQVSIANLASRYILEQQAVGAVIIGARLGSSEHLADTLKLFTFSITEANKKKIAAALQNLKAIPGDCGDEYRKPPFLTASGDLSHHLEAFPAPYKTKVINDKTHALSGTVWEDLAGYSRAVRQGKRILISGTTATHKDRVIGGKDPAAQTHFVIDKLGGGLQSLGASLDNVIRTRVYIKHMSDWEAIARAHGERFKEILPANTLIRADLVGDDYLVEMEAEAELP
ncbi:MAG: aldo/keto reductase [Trueperaceae bacterium]|nr:aldo/keto reductase [Trueperaceae bacterium]